MSVSESFIDRVIQRRGVRQFVKFCIVGGLSTVIDLGLHGLLMFKVTIGGELLSHIVGQWSFHLFHPGVMPAEKDLYDWAFGILKILPVCLAIYNSFYWNRKWTFRVLGKEALHRQVVKFYTVALIGMVLNVVISTSVNNAVVGHALASWAKGSIVAMVVVSFWNFFGQKLWTFKKDMR